MNPTSATESSPSSFAWSGVGPKEALDAHAHGDMDVAELTATLLERCREDSETTWDALSLLDQYHRRRLLDTNAFLAIKGELHSRFFGLRSAAQDGVSHPPRFDVSVADRLNSGALDAVDKQQGQRTTQIAVESSNGGSPHVGMVLRDRYMLVAPIVSTFATNTFKAFDRRRAGLPEQECYVSIKCLRDDFAASAVARDALHREFTLARNLSHPSILKLYEFYQDDNDCFIVMELLQGQLLTHVLERFAPRPIARLQALAIVREIGLALAHAHREGVSHTNLSPDTVSILRSGEIRVFGFAAAERMLEGVTPNGNNRPIAIPIDRSRPSPNDSQPAVRDDLFSLACVTYRLLSGQTPFARQAPSTTVAGTIERKWRRIPTLPSKQWRAIEQALSVKRAQGSPEIREWLTAFDSNAALSVTPLSELQPDYARTSGSRNQAYGVALSILVAALLVVTWDTFWTQPIEFQPVGFQQADQQLPPVNTKLSSPDMAKYPDTAARRSSGEIIADESTPKVSDKSPKAAGDVASTKDQGDWNANTYATADKRTMDAASVRSASQPASAAKPTSPSTKKPTVRTAIVNTPTVGFIADQYVVNEGETTAKITLRRAGSVRDESLIYWRTQEGSAKAHRDFVPTEHGAAIFPPGERTVVILVPIVQGEPRRFSAWFAVDIEVAQNAKLGPIANATVFIVSARSNPATAGEN